MLYGYNSRVDGPKRACQNCESLKWQLADECFFCGAPGCDVCMTLETEAESDGSYRGDRLVCGRCLDRRAA